MAQVTEAEVYGALSRVQDPDLHKDIVRLGFIKDLKIEGGSVSFRVVLTTPACPVREQLQEQSRAVVSELPGVTSVSVTMDAEVPKGRGIGEKLAMEGVRNIIAVSSGKGGVGKSTVAVNLALGLQALGLKIGILDADIYGPSMPKLFGLHGKPRVISGRILEPLDGYGVKVMSIGFMVEEETPMIWRGPMVMSAITQMLREVAWGDLDVLVVDMPPGTGDAQLTMAQATPLAGAVIVSTPQDLALIDARRGVSMFKRVEIPILGIVENMATFVCPHCGQSSHIFGHGGAREEAQRLDVPFLGEVPLNMTIRELSDAGRPVVVADPEGPHARIYKDMAQQVWTSLAGGGAAKPAPRIVIE